MLISKLNAKRFSYLKAYFGFFLYSNIYFAMNNEYNQIQLNQKDRFV